MGEPAIPTQADRAATLELAREIVDSVREDIDPPDPFTHAPEDAATAALRLAQGETSEGIPMPAAPRKWHEVLGVTSLYTIYESGNLPESDLFAIAKQRHREQIKIAHPDVGGDAAIAAELNAAIAAAEAELVP